MSFASPKKYFDDRNFPRGFHRSGDFTRAQAEILESLGTVLKALHEGTQEPEDEVEAHFVMVCQGKEQAVTDIEKAWTLYLSALHRKQVYFTASSAAVTDGVSEAIDTDD
ncbi:DUF413 domain-containing protein [Oceanobacter sp. 5_MG-2023]|uniref:DUF413 domain-containing protein n=1 Tax=Oceanobacter sp. 5_MG-2023 TaxID=3062645 RepID=UPI0026E490C9|nr:DUF413 domain-containing protein [Oceanobacter sp. 5_MG-2023]MDO6682535.1 DUF413 domain-containing protein [Oceanobacter sp. 5_MG-2023]